MKQAPLFDLLHAQRVETLALAGCAAGSKEYAPQRKQIQSALLLMGAFLMAQSVSRGSFGADQALEFEHPMFLDAVPTSAAQSKYNVSGFRVSAFGHHDDVCLGGWRIIIDSVHDLLSTKRCFVSGMALCFHSDRQIDIADTSLPGGLEKVRRSVIQGDRLRADLCPYKTR